MALTSARADSVQRMAVMAEFFEGLLIWNRSARIGVLEACVDLLEDVDPLHDLVPRAVLGKSLSQFQYGLFHCLHGSRSRRVRDVQSPLLRTIRRGAFGQEPCERAGAGNSRWISSMR